MAITQLASAVLQGIADLIKGTTPPEVLHASDYWSYVPTVVGVESAPDRTFYFTNVTVNEAPRDLSCRQFELQADLVVLYNDTGQGQTGQSGAMSRVADDAQALAVALRSIYPALSASHGVTQFEAGASSTSTNSGGSQIEHSRTFTVYFRG